MRSSTPQLHSRVALLFDAGLGGKCGVSWIGNVGCWGKEGRFSHRPMTRFGRFFLQVGLFADCFVQRVVQTRGDFELPGSQLGRRDGSLQRVAFSGCGADEEPSLSPLLCVAMLCRGKRKERKAKPRRVCAAVRVMCFVDGGCER
jgi:hypothetical protein